MREDGASMIKKGSVRSDSKSKARTRAKARESVQTRINQGMLPASVRIRRIRARAMEKDFKDHATLV